MAEITRLLRGLPRNPVMARFLIARLFYTDGLNTLFAFGAIFAGRLAASMSGVELGGEIGPQMVAGLAPELREAVGQNVASAIHPIFWIAAALGAIGLLFALLLEEIPLTNRKVPVAD